jgi:hypothetical protein
LIILIINLSFIRCTIKKKAPTNELKNEFSKFKQLYEYNVKQLTNNYKQKKIKFDEKVLNKLSPQEKSILKEFHQIRENNDQNVIDLNDYLQTLKKYDKVKKQMMRDKRIMHKLKLMKEHDALEQKRKLKQSMKKKIYKKRKQAHIVKRKPKRKSSKVFTKNEEKIIHNLYHIKNRVLEASKARKLPGAKGVQKGNRVWGGATYVKLGQEHAPVFINQSPSYLYSAPKFRTNQNGVELPLPDARAFSPKQIPIAATFATRPDDLKQKDYGDADEYKYQGQPSQSIDIQKAWTLPTPGYMPMVDKYPASQRQLIQIDSNPLQSNSSNLNKGKFLFRILCNLVGPSTPSERNLRVTTMRPTGIFSPPERTFNDDNIILKMRNSYPIDEALQVAGQSSMSQLVDSSMSLNNLEDSIETAGEKIANMKSMFKKNDIELEKLLSDLYDIHINY